MAGNAGSHWPLKATCSKLLGFIPLQCSRSCCGSKQAEDMLWILIQYESSNISRCVSIEAMKSVPCYGSPSALQANINSSLPAIHVQVRGAHCLTLLQVQGTQQDVYNCSFIRSTPSKVDVSVTNGSACTTDSQISQLDGFEGPFCTPLEIPSGPAPPTLAAVVAEPPSKLQPSQPAQLQVA